MTPIHILWADDGQHIRKWARDPFAGSTEYAAIATPIADDAVVTISGKTLHDYVDRAYVRQRIGELMDEEDGGFWRACCGCQESVDGCVSTTDYPYNETFCCQPGSGCRECGGIGVIWDDGRGYADLGYDALAEADFTPAEGGAVHGLGPQALTFEDDADGFSPVAMLRGGCVYLQQGSAQITLSIDVADRLAAALARSRAAVGEQSREWWKLEWIAAPRPPVHMKPMRGSQSFDTAEEALAFWRGKPDDSTYVGLTKHVQTSTLQSPPAKVER